MHPSGTKVLILAPQLVDNAVGRHVMLVMMSVTMTLKNCVIKPVRTTVMVSLHSIPAGECYRTLSEVKPENDNKLKAQACFLDQKKESRSATNEHANFLWSDD